MYPPLYAASARITSLVISCTRSVRSRHAPISPAALPTTLSCLFRLLAIQLQLPGACFTLHFQKLRAPTRPHTMPSLCHTHCESSSAADGVKTFAAGTALGAIHPP